MPDNNKVIFEERQSQPLYMRLGIPLIMLAISGWVHFSSPSSDIWASIFVAMTGLIIAIAITTPKLITKVDFNSVSLRRRFYVYSKILFQDITSVQETSYKEATSEYGGFSLFASTAYFYIGDRGVLIHHNEGKFTFVSSKQANELVMAINNGCQQHEQSKYA
ncbi:MAG: hypothetical protein AAF936_14480 [Pseudomonadota bacterium]